jgi:two-component system alkaline phosphatase synthesis response regulator PhoP
VTDTGAAPAEIVVVEDDPEIAFVLDFMFRREGHRVTVLADGRAALERIESGPPGALVVLDTMLPFADGIQVLTALRAAPAWSATPVVMLTAKSQERDIVRALEAGANDYLVKPFQPAELSARVKRLLPKVRP